MTVRALVKSGSAEAGQASILAVGFAFLCAFLVVIVIAVGRVYVSQSQLQKSADLAASAASTGGFGDDQNGGPRDVAINNGAESFEIVDAKAANLGGLVDAGDPTTKRGSSTASAAQVTSNARVVKVTRAVPEFFGYGFSFSSNDKLTAIAVIPEPQVISGGVGHGGAATGTPYTGPLVSFDSAVICPAVAADYRAMQGAAAASGIRLWATSGWRSVSEQAALYAQLGPRLAAPPGQSLHHSATELDISVGPAGSPTHNWLQMNGAAFGFVQRYSWEPWHWGNVRGC